jgi:hypothetical protein
MTYMPEPAPASPYEGNAAARKLRLKGWRLPLSDLPPEEVLADPEGRGAEGGRSVWLRAFGTMGTAVAAWLVLTALAPALPELLGPPALRVALMVLIAAIVDSIVFYGHRADGLPIVAATQSECLKWMEGMEIGYMEWRDLTDILLWQEEREGESATAQTRRGGRRLLLCDRLGKRLCFPEQDATFDAMLVRLRLERPDLPTRVISSWPLPAPAERSEGQTANSEDNESSSEPEKPDATVA